MIKQRPHKNPYRNKTNKMAELFVNQCRRQHENIMRLLTESILRRLGAKVDEAEDDTDFDAMDADD